MSFLIPSRFFKFCGTLLFGALVLADKVAKAEERDEIVLAESVSTGVKDQSVDIANHLSPGARVDKVVSECPCLIVKKGESPDKFVLSSAPQGFFRENIIIRYSNQKDGEIESKKLQIVGWNALEPTLELRFLGPPSKNDNNDVTLVFVATTSAIKPDDISIAQKTWIKKVAIVKSSERFAGIEQLYRWIFAVELSGDHPLQIPIVWRRNAEIREELFSYAPRTVRRQWK